MHDEPTTPPAELGSRSRPAADTRALPRQAAKVVTRLISWLAGRVSMSTWYPNVSQLPRARVSDASSPPAGVPGSAPGLRSADVAARLVTVTMGAHALAGARGSDPVNFGPVEIAHTTARCRAALSPGRFEQAFAAGQRTPSDDMATRIIGQLVSIEALRCADQSGVALPLGMGSTTVSASADEQGVAGDVAVDLGDL